MNWDDVGGKLVEIGKNVPGGLKLLGGIMTATGIGAPAGAGMMAVGTLLAHALGTDNTPDALHAALSTDPAAAEKALEVESNNRVQLQQILTQQAIVEMQEETKQQVAVLGDKQSARVRDAQIVQLGKTNVRADLMLLGAYLITAVIVMVMVFGKVDGGSAIGGVLILLAGKFAGNIATAFDFEFGSSRGSVEKSAVMATQASDAATTASTAAIAAVQAAKIAQ